MTQQIKHLTLDLEEYQEKSRLELDEFKIQTQTQSMELNDMTHRALVAEESIISLQANVINYEELNHKYETLVETISHYELELTSKAEIINELTSTNTLLNQTKTSLEILNLELEQKLASSSTNTNQLDDTNKQLQSEINKLKTDLKDIRHYSLALEQESEKFKKLMSTENALQTQNNELKRLQLKIDSLSQELDIKERENQQIMEQCRRHEGESAGKSITLDSLSVEYEHLLNENEVLSKKLTSETRHNKDLKRDMENLTISMKLSQNNSNSNNNSNGNTPHKNPHTTTAPSITTTTTTTSNEIALIQSNLVKEVSKYPNKEYLLFIKLLIPTNQY